MQILSACSVTIYIELDTPAESRLTRCKGGFSRRIPGAKAGRSYVAVGQGEAAKDFFLSGGGWGECGRGLFEM